MLVLIRENRCPTSKGSSKDKIFMLAVLAVVGALFFGLFVVLVWDHWRHCSKDSCARKDGPKGYELLPQADPDLSSVTM